MANPRVKDGYIRYANEYIKARMMTGPLKERVWKAIEFECWGWQDRREAKQPVPITRGRISELTGISDKSLISKLIGELVKENKVHKVSKGGITTPCYWPNQDYEQWIDSDSNRVQSHPREQSHPIPREQSHPIPREQSHTPHAGDTLLHERKYKENINKDTTTTFSVDHDMEPTGVVAEFLEYFRDEIQGQGFVDPYQSFKRIYKDLGNDDIVLRLRLETALETCSKDGKKPSIIDVMKYLRRSVVDDIKDYQEELKNRIILGFGDDLQDWEFERITAVPRAMCKNEPGFCREAKRRYEAWLVKQQAKEAMA